MSTFLEGKSVSPEILRRRQLIEDHYRQVGWDIQHWFFLSEDAFAIVKKGSPNGNVFAVVLFSALLKLSDRIPADWAGFMTIKDGLNNKELAVKFIRSRSNIKAV